MPRLRRNRDPSLYRHITIRTEEARLWMLPSRNMEKLLGGIVARYQEICGISIYAYNFLSNHYHMVIKAPKRNTDVFCENVNREIARRVNWMHRRTAHFWEKPYTDQTILTEGDLLEAFLYTTTNPVHHGLVDHASKWTGLSSYSQSLSFNKRQFTFYYYSEEDPAQRAKTHHLTLSLIPEFKAVPLKKRRDHIKALIEERTQSLIKKRRENGQGFLGMHAILTQEPGSLPFNVAKSPKPSCYSKEPVAIREFEVELKERERAYDEASASFRSGNLNAEFPIHSFKPPLHREPRLFPFTPCPDDSFKKAA